MAKDTTQYTFYILVDEKRVCCVSLKRNAIIARMKHIQNALPSPMLHAAYTILMLLLLTACATGTVAQPTLVPTQGPTAVVVNTATAASTPTETIAAAIVVTAVSAPSSPAQAQTATASTFASADTIPQGITDEGYYFLGREDAPNIITMYSDAF